MPERSKKIRLRDNEEFKSINPENLKLYEKYKRDMTIRELSVNSIKQYQSDLVQWMLYIKRNQGDISVRDITDDDLEEYFFFRKENGNNANRIKRIMSSIGAFYIFLKRKKLIKESPMEFIERPKNIQLIETQTFLTAEQVDLLRDRLSSYNDIQLMTYIFFGLSTMARASAMANLHWIQVDFEQRMCTDVLEKEGKIVTLFFSEEVAGYLKTLLEYRRTNHIEDYGYVFSADKELRGKPISLCTLNMWCKIAGNMIGVPTLHNHDLRHSGSNLLKDSGCPIEVVSKLLHHESIDTTTKFYLKDNQAQIQNIKDQYGL